MINRIISSIAAIGLIVIAAVAVLVAATPRLAPAVAQASAPAIGSQQAPGDTSTGITVAGQGRVFVKPNVALATIGVDVTTASLADATSQSNAKMGAVIDKIKSLGVADKDIQTSNYSLTPITTQSKSPDSSWTPVITGYRVTNLVRVTVRKIDDLGKILDSAVGAGANSVYGVSFAVDDLTPYQQQARAAAVKDAQDKAGQLAKSANVQVGSVIAITEGAVQTSLVAPSAVRFSVASGSDVPVQTGETQVSVDVTVRFAIK
jgi:uncharacterized protein